MAEWCGEADLLRQDALAESWQEVRPATETEVQELCDGDARWMSDERQSEFFVAHGALWTVRLDPAYEAYLAEQDRMCGRGIEFGPAHDSYGTQCELDRGHRGEHRGPDSLSGEGYLYWTGGGYCAGDPLPYRGLRRSGDVAE